MGYLYLLQLQVKSNKAHRRIGLNFGRIRFDRSRFGFIVNPNLDSLANRMVWIQIRIRQIATSCWQRVYQLTTLQAAAAI